MKLLKKMDKYLAEKEDATSYIQLEIVWLVRPGEKDDKLKKIKELHSKGVSLGGVMFSNYKFIKPKEAKIKFKK